jgi:Ca2+-binding RTX toxin-like protein
MRRMLFVAATLAMALAFAGPALADFWIGTNDNDIKKGTEGADTLIGRGGNDRLSGLGAIDKISGNGGRDKLYGGDGADNTAGGSGGDLIVAGGGTDNIQGAAGDDTIYTGTKAEGNDGDSDEVRYGPGHDKVFLFGPDHAAHNLEARDVCEEITNY